MMKLRAILIGVLLMGLAGALSAQPAEAPPPGDVGLPVVPLIDEDAPLVMVWFTEALDVPLDDASAIETQLFEDIGKRMDLRMFSREKALKLVNETGDQKLQQCKWEDDCLKAIGRLVEADQVIGVKMSGSGGQYYLAFKHIALDEQPQRKTAMVGGSMSKLLMSGIGKTLTELLGPAEQQPAGEPTAPAAEDGASRAPAAGNDPAAVAVVPLVPEAEPTAEPVAAPAPQATPEPESRPAVEPAPAAAEPGPQAPKARVVEARPRDEQPPPPPRGPGFFRRHLGSTIALGVGLAAAGAGIGFGVMADQAQNDVSHQYDPTTDDAGRNNALAANVLFGVAGAAAITAVVLFIVEPGPSADDTAGVDVVATGTGALVRF